MKAIFIIIAILIALYFLFILLLYFTQNKMVYVPPDLAQIDLSPVLGFVHQVVTTEDSIEIKGYYLAPKSGKPILVEFHGNGSHPAWEAPKFRKLAEDGYGLLLAEYRGYGGNLGIPSEENLYRDGEAYLSWVKSNPDLKERPVVIYGSSIGSGVAVDVARRHPEISALILEVPFDKLSAVGAFHYPYIPLSEYIMKNKFNSGAKIKDIKVPVLFMLAKHDTIVPIQFGQALADAANEPKQVHIFEEANHINAYSYGAEDIVRKFLKEYLHE